jgi:hypothetical protein
MKVELGFLKMDSDYYIIDGKIYTELATLNFSHCINNVMNEFNFFDNDHNSYSIDASESGSLDQKFNHFKLLNLKVPDYQDDLVRLKIDIDDQIITDNSIDIDLLRCNYGDEYRTDYSICGSINNNNNGKEILFISVDKGGKIDSKDKFDFYWVEKGDNFKIQDIVNNKKEFPYISETMEINLVDKLSSNQIATGEELFKLNVKFKG